MSPLMVASVGLLDVPAALPQQRSAMTAASGALASRLGCVPAPAPTPKRCAQQVPLLLPGGRCAGGCSGWRAAARPRSLAAGCVARGSAASSEPHHSSPLLVGGHQEAASSHAPSPAVSGMSKNRRNKLLRRSKGYGPALDPRGSGSGGAPSGAQAPPSSPKSGGGSTAAVATAAPLSRGAVVVLEAPLSSGNDSDGEFGGDGSGALSSSATASNIVSFVSRQPRALVLDCAYRPINVITWYKAFHFEYYGRGEVVDYYPPPAVCVTGQGEYPLPAVLRVPQYTANMEDLCSKVVCTRRNVMVRDAFTCQYCGSKRGLTIDHVHPQSKGGGDTWDNLVACCQRCNQAKGDRSLRELGWRLKKTPKEPSPYEIGIVAGISTSDILRPPAQWADYIAPYKERMERYRQQAIEAGLANLLEMD